MQNFQTLVAPPPDPQISPPPLRISGYVRALFIDKTRVAPIKAVLIPRFELTAVRFSIRFCQMMQKELTLPNSRFVH